jgi:Ras-related protein Rab-5C
MIRTFSFKCVIIGEAYVGKTSILIRYLKKKFTNNYIPTLGANFTQTDLKLNEEMDGKLLKNLTEEQIEKFKERMNEIDSRSKLVLWDLAGQKLFENIRKYYMMNSDVVVIIADLSNLESSNLQYWLDMVNEICPKAEIVIVGNKSDLNEDLKQTEQEFIDILENSNNVYNDKIPIVSAKDGDGIRELFQTIKLRLISSIC